MKNKILKFSILFSFSFATLFGLGISYSGQNGITIGADREALAFSDYPWTNSWKDCNVLVLVMGENGPESGGSRPGLRNECKWASNDTCDKLICSLILTPE